MLIMALDNKLPAMQVCYSPGSADGLFLFQDFHSDIRQI